VGCGSRLERRDGLDRNRCLRQEVKEFRKMSLHLGDVLAKVFDDGLGGDGPILGVAFGVSAEGGEVRVPLALASTAISVEMRSTSFKPIS
jgi:hypothetical protein